MDDVLDPVRFHGDRGVQYSRQGHSLLLCNPLCVLGDVLLAECKCGHWNAI